MSLSQSSDHSGQVVQFWRLRDVLAKYPNLREDHVRYLVKWRLVRPPASPDGLYTFADVSVLRQVSAEMTRGVAFRSVVRSLAAERDGQMTLDFRPDAEPARIVTLRPRRFDAAVATEVVVDRAAAEHHFETASALDDGTPAHHEAAADGYRKALEADPYLIPALINLGNLYYSRDHFVEAQALYERALLLQPDVYEAHFNLGNIHHDRGRLELARECYAEAVGLNGEYADAHFYLAVTLEKLGRSGEARPHWRAYQRLAPNGEWIDLAKEFGD